MKRFESYKLFYGKYLYRLEINNSLATTFREKNLPYAKKKLDQLQQNYDNQLELIVGFGLRKTPVDLNDFIDAKRLYHIFSNYNDYKLRVERNFLNIYANDLSWLEKIINTVDKESVVSLHKPDPTTASVLTPNTIVVEKSNGYEYKVTVNLKRGSPSFAKWANNNPNLIKMGSQFYEMMLNEDYVYGMYFYARDEKVLQLCNLMIDKIGRIDKLVVKSDI